MYIAGPRVSIDYSDLHKRLSKGGIDIGIFMEEKLIEKKKEKVIVLSPLDRREHIETKINKGKKLLTIDKVHLLYAIYKEGKPISKYWDEYGGDDVKKVADLIYRKTGDKIYAKISGKTIRAPKKKKGHPTLDAFLDVGGDKND